MPPIPFRIGRRRSIWEDGSVFEIAKSEFSNRQGGLELRPSVYVVEPSAFDRARAEHLGGLRLEPSPGVVDLDLMGLAPVAASAGSGPFAFTRAAHAEVILDDEAHVEGVVARLKAEPTRRHPRSVTDVLRYVADRVSAADPEWLAALKEHPRLEKALEKWRNKVH